MLPSINCQLVPGTGLRSYVNALKSHNNHMRLVCFTNERFAVDVLSKGTCPRLWEYSRTGKVPAIMKLSSNKIILWWLMKIYFHEENKTSWKVMIESRYTSLRNDIPGTHRLSLSLVCVHSYPGLPLHISITLNLVSETIGVSFPLFK